MARKSTRFMTPEERITYRRKKRLIRRIQVYAEIAIMALVIIVISGLLIFHITNKNEKPKLAKEETAVSKEAAPKKEESKGLKVEAKASKEPSEKTAIEDEQVATSMAYSASKSENTVPIEGDVVSEYAILIDNDSKQIVGERNASERIVPASMTKVLTVLVAANHIKEEQLDEVVTMSHEAVDYSYAGGGSTSGFVEDEGVTVRDLFYGTILPSGGDAAAQLAMYVAGDIDSFVKMMNEECVTLGINNTSHFTNPVGFHNEDHYSTPYDIAIIMMAALDNDFLKEVISTKVYNTSPTNVNPDGIILSNWFLRRIEDKDLGGGTIVGAKTGYVDESGSCAVSAMISASGKEYICCTAKSNSSWRCIYDHVDIYKAYAK